VVGGLVIVLDPIFQGLAVSLIFGVIVATALTLVVIPLLYFFQLRHFPVSAAESQPEPAREHAPETQGVIHVRQ
jgi:hypothetical protein